MESIMKSTTIVLLLICVMLVIVGMAYATATSETGDTRAMPVSAYGKTAAGVLKPILVASDGTTQTA